MRFTLLFVFQILLLGAINAQSLLYYTVKFPDDVTVYGCNAAPPFVQPEIVKYGNCSFDVGVSYQDQVFYLGDGPGCYKIFRRWRLLWWCDYDPNWQAPTYIENPDYTNVGVFTEGNSDNHGYLQYTQVIKVLDNVDPVFADCPAAPLEFKDFTTNNPQLWNSMQWWDSQSGSHDLCEGPTDLSITATDSCSGADITLRYLLFLDLDNTGTMETVVSSTNLPPANTLFFNNFNTPNYAGGNARSFDTRNVPANQKYAFALETVTNGANVTGRVRWTTAQSPNNFVVPELPYGTHKIKWIAEDGCGNEKSCEYLFTVKDGEPPTVVCLNGLSINLTPTGMVDVWASDFIHNLYDNCTPTPQIKIAIQKVGSGTTFPAGQNVVTFDCTELGLQPVEIWVQDNADNADHCFTYILVQDNFGACAPGDPFTGTVQMAESQEPLAGTELVLKQNGAVLASAVSDSLGQFAFGSMPAGCDYQLSASATGDAQAGLNVYDVLLGALHQVGLPVLPTPYNIIASDADGNGVLNTADLQAMIQVLLGVDDTFPGEVWQFLPSGYAFANPTQPLSAVLPEHISLCLTGPTAPGAADFKAVKTGDLDVSWQAGESRSVDGSVFFSTVNQRFEAGEILDVVVYAPDLSDLRAFQLALGWDPEVLTFLGSEGLMVPDNWMFQVPDNQEVRACWYSTQEAVGKNWRPGVFTLKFEALQMGTLKKNLFVRPGNLAAEVYRVDGQSFAAELDFIQPDAGSFLVRPAMPNPASNLVMVPFELAEACEMTVTLSDALGRTVAVHSKFYDAGSHVETLDVSRLEGVVMVRLSALSEVRTQRVVVKN